METYLKKPLGIFVVLAVFCTVVLAFAVSPVFAVDDEALQQFNQSTEIAAAGISLSKDESRLLELINGDRSEAGVPELNLNEKLSELARLKAEDMANNNYLSYTSRTHGTLEDMLERAGLEYRHVGQKIARASAPVSVDLLHSTLMCYESHCRDILDSRYDTVGVAVVNAGEQKYVVEIFAGERQEPEQNGLGQYKPNPAKSNPESKPGSKPEHEQSSKPESNQQTGQQNNEVKPDSPAGSGNTGVMAAGEKQVLELVNNERTSRGLQPLKADAALVKLARLKAGDMLENGDFAGGTFVYKSSLDVFEMLHNMGVQFAGKGKNLAIAGSSVSPASAHDFLMNHSEKYRKNILSADFDRIGIGIVEGDGYKYIVLLFIESQSGGNDSQSEAALEPGAQPGQEQKSESPAGSGSSGGESEPNSASIQGLTPDERQMLSLVNKERASRGLHELRPNLKLTQIARLKARDMIKKGYFSHTSPTYGSPFDMMRQFGIKYNYAGENLAGAPTVLRAHEALMNSPGHRKNILNENFHEVGIGIVNGGPYGKMFVQMFTG